MGLNDSFSQVKTQILLMDPLPSINKDYFLFIQEKMQRNVGSSLWVESTILATKDQTISSTSCFNSKGKERPVCTHYGKLGHIVDKCYKLHGFPPGFKFKNKNSMAHQASSSHDWFQGQLLSASQDFNAVTSTHSPSFTPN